MTYLRQDHEAWKSIVLSPKQPKIPIHQENPNDENIRMEPVISTAVVLKNCYDNRRRIKKPARLIPISFFRFALSICKYIKYILNFFLKFIYHISRSRTNAAEAIFNDSPTNCRDLNHIGHTLNGYYPVQLKLDGEQKPSKIGMIYCNFNLDAKTPPENGIFIQKYQYSLLNNTFF